MLKLNSCQKIIIILFIAFISNKPAALGQFKNFGSQAKHKPQPNYFYSVYAYYDLVRESGVGIQYQLLPSYSIDISAYFINPTNYLKDKILQWDYYDLKGYGFSLRPKYHFSSLGNWYVTPNISFEWLGHGKVWVKEMVYYHQIVNYLTETNGKAYTVGLNFGRKIIINRFFLEPFIGFGVSSFKGEKTTYAIDDANVFPSQTYPIKDVYRQDFFQTNIGLKLGFSFKKSKKHAAIDKKFDDVYIPKAVSLNNYFKPIDPKTIENSKYLRKAYSRTKKLNSSALWRYKKNYADTAQFYRKMDTLFSIIDALIIKGNQ